MLFFTSVTLEASFIEGQELNVLAKSGLKLREAPIAGKTLSIIPYGAQVTVLNSSEFTCLEDQIEWTKGRWIEVSYEGQRGFVFDGFLSDFPLPELEFELNQFEMDLMYPLEAWVEYRLVETGQKVDTLINNHGGNKTIQHFTDGKWMKEDKGEMYSVELHLVNVRLMDVYQLLQAMYTDKFKTQTFKNKSVFVKDEFGDVVQVKISLDEFINIRKISDDHIRLRILVSESGCE